MFIPHQANLRIIDYATKEAGLPLVGHRVGYHSANRGIGPCLRTTGERIQGDGD